jgi:hypothetical protein
VRVFFLARPPTEMRCRCRPRTWGGGVGCETVLTGERDDKTHHGVAGEGEEANLGFRVRVGSEGLTGAEILGFRVWEGSPELKVVGLRGMSRGGGPAVGAERGMGGGEAGGTAEGEEGEEEETGGERTEGGGRWAWPTIYSSMRWEQRRPLWAGTSPTSTASLQDGPSLPLLSWPEEARAVARDARCPFRPRAASMRGGPILHPG